MHSRHLMKPLMMLSNLKQIAIAKSIIGLAQRKKNVRYVMSGSLAPYGRVLQQHNVSGSGIEWKYLFGGRRGRTFDRYYKAEINGKLVEKHASNRGVKYSIGNIDEAKKKYKTEKELSEACFA